MIYLQEHRVSIGVAVEVSIVSVLREVIVRGVLETLWVQVLVACVFLLVLGALLVIRVWLPPTFDGIDPEQFISERHQSRLHGRSHSKQHPIQNTLTSHPDVSRLSTTEIEELLSNRSVSS